MNEHTLLQTLAAVDTAQVPAQADVLLLQAPTRAQLQARARQFVSLLRQDDGCPGDRAGTWQEHEDRTVVHLPDGARAIVHHASGALRYASGLAPAEAAFARGTERDALLRLVEERARKLALADWAGPGSQLRFERLFQTLGRGADPTGKQSDTTLFRATGAWRQFIGTLPVLGAASGAIRLAGDGRLDGLAIRVRPGSGEVLDRAAILGPEAGARQVVLQLSALLGQREIPEGLVESAAMEFGYLDLGKRKVQRVLAPVYVARVVLRHRSVRQAYVLAARATERPHLELPLYGGDTAAQRGRPDWQGCHDPAR